MDFSELIIYIVRNHPDGFKPSKFELTGRVITNELDGEIKEYSIPEAFEMLVRIKYLKESLINRNLVKLIPTAHAFSVIAKTMLAALDRRMAAAVSDYCKTLKKSKPKSRKRLKPFVAKLFANNEREHEFREAVKTFFGIT